MCFAAVTELPVTIMTGSSSMPEVFTDASINLTAGILMTLLGILAAYVFSSLI